MYVCRFKLHNKIPKKKQCPGRVEGGSTGGAARWSEMLMRCRQCFFGAKFGEISTCKI